MRALSGTVGTLAFFLTGFVASAAPASRNPCLRPDPARYYVSAPSCDAEALWSGRAYRVHTNAQGLRNRETGAKGMGPRVLLVGSSENYGPGLANEELPAVTLERELQKARPGLELVNASVEGYSTVQHLAAFDAEYLQRYRPDYVVYVVSWAAIFSNALHRVTSSEGADGLPHLWYFPRALEPHLPQWPRLGGAVFATMHELAWMYLSWRTRLRLLFGADDTLEVTAGYLRRAERLAAAKGVPFLVLFYAPSEEQMYSHYRDYYFSPLPRWILNLITPAPRIDGTRLPEVAAARGLHVASFTPAEMADVFGGHTIGGAYHVDPAGAGRFGAMMAKKILEWKAGPASVVNAETRAPLPSKKRARSAVPGAR